MICENILLITFLNEPELIFFGIELNDFKNFDIALIICLHIVKWFQAPHMGLSLRIVLRIQKELD